MPQDKQRGQQLLARADIRDLRADAPDTRVLAGNLTLTFDDDWMQHIDPGGAGRTITLPAEADSSGKAFLIVNEANAEEDLTVNDDGGTTRAIIGEGQSAWLACDGTTWRALQGLQLDKVAGATFVVGDQAGNIINVAIQLIDALGNDLAEAAAVPWYLADDAAGLDPSTVAHSAGASIGTDGALIEWTANLSGMAISEADGDIDIDFEEAGALTRYLVLVMPNGELAISGAITHA